MANIQQAAKWMQEGKEVRRAYWKEHGGTCSLHSDKLNVLNEDDKFAEFILAELLADDWEIFESANIGKPLEK